MPWCEPCEKNWTPTSVKVDGTCPECGERLEPTPGVDHSPTKIPWHFYVGVAAASIYLIWRAVQGLVALF